MRQQAKETGVESYAGSCTIGLNVADLVTTLTSSDENPFNKDCFEKSATEAGLGEHHSGRSTSKGIVRGTSIELTMFIINKREIAGICKLWI